MDPRAKVKDGINLDGTPVKILVGALERCIFVHPDILRAHSQFFQSALKKDWKEGQDCVVKLPDDRPELLVTYIQWLYTGKIITDLKCDDPANHVPDYLPLVKVYVLAEKLLDPVFQDCVINSLVATARQTYKDGKRFPIPYTSVNYMYSNTSPGSPGRLFLLDRYVRYGDRSCLSTDKEMFNKEFVLDLAVELLENRHVLHSNVDKYAQLDGGMPCKYHVHGKNNLCGQEKK